MYKWKFDPIHSSIEFSVKHLGVSWVKGRFTDLQGTAEFDPADPENISVQAEIETKSIWTGNDARDNHLRSKDFFDVLNHPAATFKSKKAEKISNNGYRLKGELTIRGVTKEITLDLQGPVIQEIPSSEGGKSLMHAGFSAKTTINRHDFGVSWDAPAGEGMTTVGGEVDININVEAVKE